MFHLWSNGVENVLNTVIGHIRWKTVWSDLCICSMYIIRVVTNTSTELTLLCNISEVPC